MKLDKLKNGNLLGLFDIKQKENSNEREIVNFAADYWTNAIMRADENQINVQMGNDVILLSENELEQFKNVFTNYILEIFPDNGRYINLWTSNGQYFDRIGVDAYLNQIMKNCNLPLTCLPSDICMWIYSDRIEIEDNYQQEVIYNSRNKQVK